MNIKMIAYVNRKYFWGPFFFTKKSPSVQHPLLGECNTSQAQFGDTFISAASVPSDIFSLFSSQETQYKNTFTVSMKDVVGKTLCTERKANKRRKAAINEITN